MKVPTFDESRLVRTDNSMGNGGQAGSKTLSRKLSKIIDQHNRPELGDQFSTFNFRNQGDHLVETRYVNSS